MLCSLWLGFSAKNLSERGAVIRPYSADNLFAILEAKIASHSLVAQLDQSLEFCSKVCIVKTVRHKALPPPALQATETI